MVVIEKYIKSNYFGFLFIRNFHVVTLQSVVRRGPWAQVEVLNI